MLTHPSIYRKSGLAIPGPNLFVSHRILRQRLGCPIFKKKDRAAPNFRRAVDEKKRGKKRGKENKVKNIKGKQVRIGSFAGLQRAITSSFLKGIKWKRADRRRIFAEAAAYVQEVIAAGGPELEEFRRRGRLGQIARRAGGSAFGAAARPAGPPAEPMPDQLPPPPPGDNLALVLAAAADGQLQIIEGVAENPDEVTLRIKREQRAARAGAASKMQESVKAFSEWQGKQNEHKAASLIPGVTLDGIGTEINYIGDSVDNSTFSMMEWNPPVHEIIGKVLSSVDGKSLQILRKFWQERHRPLVAKAMPPLSPNTKSVSLCRIAGFVYAGTMVWRPG